MKNDGRYVDDDATTIVFARPPASALVSPPPRDDDQLWDANDVARYLKVSRSWVYHRAEAGLLPLRRVGGLLRFVPAAIRAFAAGEWASPGASAGDGWRSQRPAGRRPPR
jgi:predicted DNA-binding transcriptional regulator AlpA